MVLSSPVGADADGWRLPYLIATLAGLATGVWAAWERPTLALFERAGAPRAGAAAGRPSRRRPLACGVGGGGRWSTGPPRGQLRDAPACIQGVALRRATE